MRGEGLDDLVAEGPDDESVQIPGHDFGAVFDCFAPADLGVLRIKDDREAAELVNAYLEGDPRPCAALVEKQTPGLHAEWLGMVQAGRLELFGQGEYVLCLFEGKVGFFEEMVHDKFNHG